VQADLEVEFCLAVQDPDGNATTGIERHNFGQASWGSNAFNSTVKPATIWDRNSYCNFWIANLMKCLYRMRFDLSNAIENRFRL